MSDRALKKVIEYCESIVRMDWRVSDDEIKTAEAILNIINKEFMKMNKKRE